MKKTIIRLSIILTVLLSALFVSLFFSPMNVQVKQNKLVPYGTFNDSGELISIVRLIVDGHILCSGTVIDNNYVLTAAHCVSDDMGFMLESTVRVVDLEEKYQTTGTIVALNKKRDIALIKGDFSKFAFIKADFDGDFLSVDTNYLTCGYPSGGNSFCSRVRIKGNSFFQLVGSEGLLYQGMSGGPLVYHIMNDDGSGSFVVVGVNSAVTSDSTLYGPLVGALQEWGMK